MSEQPASRARRWTGPALTAGAIVEIVVAVEVAHAISWGLTLLLLLGLSIAGVSLLPRQFLSGLRAVHEASRDGRPLDDTLGDAAVRVAGTLLLAVPGLVTAALGLICLAQPTRSLVRRALAPWLARRLVMLPLLRTPRPRRGPPNDQKPAPESGHEVIDGEIESDPDR